MGQKSGRVANTVVQSFEKGGLDHHGRPVFEGIKVVVTFTIYGGGNGSSNKEVPISGLSGTCDRKGHSFVFALCSTRKIEEAVEREGIEPGDTFCAYFLMPIERAVCEAVRGSL